MKNIPSSQVYKVSVRIKNIEDIMEFARIISKLPIFQKLTYEQKLRIIYSYPFEYEIY